MGYDIEDPSVKVRLDIHQGPFQESYVPLVERRVKSPKPERQLYGQRVEVLPPKDRFVFSLRYLLDLSKATDKERRVMEKLIKRFENDKQK